MAGSGNSGARPRPNSPPKANDRDDFQTGLFNLATGAIAVVLLPLLPWIIRRAQQHLDLDAGATSLAAFHTVFILVGVAMFLPFVHRFARWIERRLPEREPTLTRHLDATLLHAPTVALEATRRAFRETAGELFAAVRAILAGERNGREEPRRVQLQQALDQTQEFFARIPPVNEDEPLSPLRVAQLHAIDHLARLLSLLPSDGHVQPVLNEERVRPMAAQGRAMLELGEAGLSGRAPADGLARMERAAAALAEQQRQERPTVLEQTAGSPAKALEILDAMRWLDRVGYHTWRICHYLGGDGQTTAAPAE